MSKKVLLADTNIGQFGLVLAGTVVETTEQRYTLLNAAKAPLADYTTDMDAVISAYQNQAKILPDGRSHIDLASSLEAAGLYTPPAAAEDIADLQGDVEALQTQQGSDETTIALKEVRPVVRAVVVATPFAALVDTLVPVDATAGAMVVNLPTAVGISGHKIIVKKVAGANTVTLDGSGAQTIDGAATKVIAADAADRDLTAVIYSDGANWIST